MYAIIDTTSNKAMRKSNVDTSRNDKSNDKTDHHHLKGTHPSTHAPPPLCTHSKT